MTRAREALWHVTALAVLAVIIVLRPAGEDMVLEVFSA